MEGLPEDGFRPSGLRILARIIARRHFEREQVHSSEKETHCEASSILGEDDNELRHEEDNKEGGGKNGH